LLDKSRHEFFLLLAKSYEMENTLIPCKKLRDGEYTGAGEAHNIASSQDGNSITANSAYRDQVYTLLHTIIPYGW